ncbi:MAG: class I SAM-dependent methyltransferase [Thaumarchaeota archaeon]|nr:class I SAM-dependent methyltransferase [Nitrososphaerota archaeon]
MFFLDNPLRRLLTHPKKFVSQYVSKGDTVADLGCGPGFYTIPIAEIVGPEGKVYAIDPDDKPIEKLNSKSSKIGYRNIEARTESAAELGSIRDHSLDFILANLVLCCMADHAGAIREIKRTLKPDGSAYMSVAKTFRRKDPRNVGKAEWRSILEGFRVIKERTSLTARWALVALKA